MLLQLEDYAGAIAQAYSISPSVPVSSSLGALAHVKIDPSTGENYHTIACVGGMRSPAGQKVDTVPPNNNLDYRSSMKEVGVAKIDLPWTRTANAISAL